MKKSVSFEVKKSKKRFFVHKNTKKIFAKFGIIEKGSYFCIRNNKHFNKQ